jgi:hypothetical protein
MKQGVEEGKRGHERGLILMQGTGSAVAKGKRGGLTLSNQRVPVTSKRLSCFPKGAQV